ncbi:MAG: tetratricopeptide repeat protein, partial [Bacteroidetes bacterium]
MKKCILLPALLAYILCCPLYLVAQEATPSEQATADKGVSPVSNPANGRVANGTTRAVIIGISDYQDPRIPDLRFAHRDAEALAAYLRSPAGGSVPEDNLRVLINEDATEARIGNALYWLLEETKEGDQVIFYFSGHGDVERKISSKPGFLLGWNANAGVYLAGGTLKVRDLQEIITTLSQEQNARVLVITDACRAGKLAGDEEGGIQITGASLAKKFANEIKILSCQPDELSVEGEQWGGGRGVFSYHLIEGLLGLADQNTDMQISLSEIRRYLEDQVSSEVSNQSPMTVGDIKEVIARVDPELLREVKQLKKGQAPQLHATNTKGAEATLLASLDSRTREKYAAFQQALHDKNFQQSEGAGTDRLFRQLMQVPELKPLYAHMRQNYAAALQDDAQQVLYKLLEADPAVCLRVAEGYQRSYQDYPQYLERAAELLGTKHFMYRTIKARQYWFEAYLQSLTIKGDQEKAQRVLAGYRKALEYQPDMPQAWLEIGLQYGFELNQPDSAKHYFNKAIQSTANWVLPYTHYANWHSSRGEFEQAKTWLDKAFAIDSNSVVTWHALYDWANRQYMPGYEINICLRSLQIDSTIACTWLSLGKAYLNVGDYKEAERAFKKAIELDPAFVSCIYWLAEVYTMTNQAEEAERYAMQLIQLDTTNASSFNFAGTVYRQFGYDMQAEVMWDKAFRLDNEHLPTLSNLAFHYLRSGRSKKAERLADQITKLAPADYSGFQTAGIVYQRTGRYSKAVEMYKKAIELNPDYHLNYAGLAVPYMCMERYPEADSMFQKALALEPGDWISKNRLALLYIKMDQPRDAAKLLNEIGLEGPNDV